MAEEDNLQDLGQAPTDESVPVAEPLLRPADSDDPLELDIDEARLLAALSYVGVLVAVPLFLRKNDPYVYWHAKQGVVLLVGLIVALIGAAWNGVIGGLLFAVIVVISIVGLVQALLGRKWKIPVIGQIADSFNI